MSDELVYKVVKPGAALAPFIDSCWMLQNPSDSAKEIVLLPDGRIDLIFARSDKEPFHINLLGLSTGPEQAAIAPHCLMFAISFHLLATEYLLHESVAGLIDKATTLPSGFWQFEEADLDDFDAFCRKASHTMESLLPTDIDDRKRRLFELLYASHGSITVKELSEQVYWSSRQINRYFNQQYGLSLKAYGNILRFRASFPPIREGKLFPQENFADQSHFIKEIKRLSGVSPKVLSQNKDDRFIQFSTLPRR